jgi:acetyltransferase
MIEQTRICTALKGVRGRQPVDIAELERIVVRFSQLVLDQPWLKEVEIKPSACVAEGINRAGCAGAVLHDPKTPAKRVAAAGDSTLSDSVCAAENELRDGTKITIRPIRPKTSRR